MVSRVIPVEPFDLIIFGGTGDLARRKILPGLFQRFRAGQIPAGSRIIGVARNDMTAAQYRKFVNTALDEFAGNVPAGKEVRAGFKQCLEFVTLDVADAKAWRKLTTLLNKNANAIRAYYLSVKPDLFAPIAQQLAAAKVVQPTCRIVIEKPLGRDLASAQALNSALATVFDETQIYRIDHYLGKETVQNLMVLRFANALLEPVWNARHIDHVQITVAETVGIGDRGGYYDRSGALRDMVQNHLMQLLCLTAMEPPVRLEADFIRDEKLKVIRALDPVALNETVRGQYRADSVEGSYHDHAGDAASNTESFIALKAHISNWRWSGVPFYLRTGKRLRARLSEIAVTFKDPPHSIFPKTVSYGANSLIIRLQPDEGITQHMIIKEPGLGGLRLVDVPLDMSFATSLNGVEIAEAYERLIMDVIRGDQTLFMRGDEVEAAWDWTDRIRAQWREAGGKSQLYDPGTSGPDDALALMHRDGRSWRPLESQP